MGAHSQVLLRAKHRSESFMIDSFNPHNNLMGLILLSPLYRWGN